MFCSFIAYASGVQDEVNRSVFLTHTIEKKFAAGDDSISDANESNDQSEPCIHSSVRPAGDGQLGERTFNSRR